MSHDAEKGKSSVPPLGCVLLFVLIILGGLAWILHLLGLSFEDWKPLRWLCYIPLAIIGVVFLPSLVKKLRRKSTIEQTESEKLLYRIDSNHKERR